MNSKTSLDFPKTFQKNLLKWFDQFGRKDLPWQKDLSPYPVYLSEIMLQQTQVSTVLSYFDRFLSRFPNIQTLAQAPLDDVLTYWAGLGYYSRAKNLHRAAQMILSDFQGQFPQTLDDIIRLPGIGRSTAGAILSISFKKPHPILDGNVKRVLSRIAAIEGAMNDPQVLEKLWALSANLTPQKRIEDYTQAIMDLGATLCTRSKPQCEICPMQSICQAYQLRRVHEFPQKAKSTQKPTKSVRCLILSHNNQLLLQKRPLKGIWGGLWSLPECALNQPVERFIEKNFNLNASHIQPLPSFKHSFTHYHLNIHPVLCTLQRHSKNPTKDYAWHSSKALKKVALPAPIKRLLENLPEHG